VKDTNKILISLYIAAGILFFYIILSISQFASSSEMPVMDQEQNIVELGNYTVIQFKVINQANQEKNYTFGILENELEVYGEEISVEGEGGWFQHVRYYSREAGKVNVTILIRMENKSSPSTTTYYLFADKL